ncbi:MAG: hypothetical protein BEN19_03870 [Epulopiscium sp. Nuni2H_MBin003]|nr:MAG: hypothetical protein BEN19_03870 [Epulopiscium sp. Nuni2H_MBin003]
MKKYLDTRYFKIALYSILVTTCAILVYRISSSTDNFLPKIVAFIDNVISIFSSVFVGFIIAYLMNPSMNFFERHLCNFLNPTTSSMYKTIRRISIGVVYFILFGTIYLFIIFLIPQLVDNIMYFVENVQANVNQITRFLAISEEYISDLEVIPDDVVQEIFDLIDINAIIDILINSLNTIISTFIASAVSITGIIFDAIISLIVAIYVLAQKETFANGSTRIVYAIFKRERAVKILAVAKEAHLMMIRFFVGKSLDSLIIGIICFVGLWIMKNPYALLISLIIGVFNMIPYFGPFIGAVPSVLITIFVGVWEAAMLIIFILVLQQFDGLYLGPKILGDSLGITPFWIISSVTIGGGIAGALGMFLACPITAVAILVTNRWIDKRLVANGVSNLPKLEIDEITPRPTPPYNKQ